MEVLTGTVVPSHAVPMIFLCAGMSFVLISQIVECIADYNKQYRNDKKIHKKEPAQAATRTGSQRRTKR